MFDDEFGIEIDASNLLLKSGRVRWKNVETILVRIASQYIQLFGEHFVAKSFYGFAFGCNADCGEVGIYANTKEFLKTAAAEYKKNSPEIYATTSARQLQNKLRWSLGDHRIPHGRI